MALPRLGSDGSCGPARSIYTGADPQDPLRWGSGRPPEWWPASPRPFAGTARASGTPSGACSRATAFLELSIVTQHTEQSSCCLGISRSSADLSR